VHRLSETTSLAPTPKMITPLQLVTSFS